MFILWFYTLVVSFLSLSRQQQREALPLFLGYLIPTELFGRMVEGNPFIPWEVGKYLGMFLLIYGISLNQSQKRGSTGWWILLLSIPGLLLCILANQNIYVDVAYNYLGIFDLSLSVIYFSNKKLSPEKIKQTFRVIFLGAVSTLIYVFFRTPDFSDLEFELNANFAVTAGFGSNQVSTVLGLAFGLLAFLWLHRLTLFNKSFWDLSLAAVFLLWSLLSFSRGGVVSAVLPILIIILINRGSGLRYSPRKISITLILGIFLLLPAVFYMANQVTKGQLLLRYKGESYGTLHANKKKDINQLTTGRAKIFESDVEIWMDNFLFGVGAGQSYYERLDYGNRKIASHVEISRLLSEHGLLGLIISIIFLVTPLKMYFSASHPFQKSFLIFCFTLAIATSMHSAMRTFVTPFFYGLAFVKIYFPQVKSSNASIR